MIKLFGGRLTIGKDLSQYSGLGDDFVSMFSQKFGIDYGKRNKLKAYKNVVYGCVSLIGESVGDYRPYIEKRIGDKWERITHEFIDLLYQPSGRDLQPEAFSKNQLFEATVIYQLLQGDAYWYMARGKSTGRPRQIIMLRADKVGTDIDPKTGSINGYFIRRETGQAIPLEVEEVLRFPLFNPESPYEGLSVIEAGNDYVATDEATAVYTKNFFNNNAGVSGVLSIKGEVTNGAWRKFVRGWREKYEGVDNAGKTMMIRDSDASFVKVGLGLNELDMSNLRKLSLADVFMMFKTPPELLGRITEGSGLGRANIETLEYIFTKYNIDKKMSLFDSILQFALQRYYQLDPSKYRICHENIIPEDKEFELKERVESVDKWKTRNEIRGEDEDGKDVEGGDQLYVPLNNIPINESTTAPTTSTSGISVKITRTVKKKELEITREKAERFRITLMRNQAKYEKQYMKVLSPIFKAQKKEALYNLEAHASGVKKASGQKLFDDSAYDDLMVKNLKPVLTSLTETQGSLAMVFAGDTENEFYLTSKIESIIEKNTRRMATNFNDETLDKLNDTLVEGIKAGEGIGDLKQRVSGVYEGIENYRAERIARTETLKASNEATSTAYEQTGYVTGKEWVVNPDACPECEAFDGKTIELDDTFLGIGSSYTYTDEKGEEHSKTNDYASVDDPPLHPNCRCTIIPVR